MSKQPGCVRQPGHEGECYVGTKVFDCGDIETHRLARLGLCFDGVSAEDIFRTTVHANPSSTTDMECASRVEDALTMLASLLRESENGGGT